MRSDMRDGRNRGQLCISDRRGRRYAIGALALLAASLWPAVGAVASPVKTLRLGSAHNATANTTIVLAPSGRTLYRLRPETTHNPLCTSSLCLSVWKPLTVRSSSTHLRAANGITGKLGIFHRADGSLQVTLRGLPLYTFSGDHKRGQSNGQDIHSFGGVWGMVPAKVSRKHPTPTPTVPPYTYP